MRGGGGDSGPLEHAAAPLMRIPAHAVCGFGDPQVLKRRADSSARGRLGVGAPGFGHVVGHLIERVAGFKGVLGHQAGHQSAQAPDRLR